MFKGVGILVGGVFIGALGAEIVRRAWPGGLDNLYLKLGGFSDTAKEAFMEGYHGAASAQEQIIAEA